MEYKQSEAIAKLNTLEIATPVLVTFSENLPAKQAMFGGKAVYDSVPGYNFVDINGKFFFSEHFIINNEKVSFNFENIVGDELTKLLVKIQNHEF